MSGEGVCGKVLLWRKRRNFTFALPLCCLLDWRIRCKNKWRWNIFFPISLTPTNFFIYCEALPVSTFSSLLPTRNHPIFTRSSSSNPALIDCTPVPARTPCDLGAASQCCDAHRHARHNARAQRRCRRWRRRTRIVSRGMRRKRGTCTTAARQNGGGETCATRFGTCEICCRYHGDGGRSFSGDCGRPRKTCDVLLCAKTCTNPSALVSACLTAFYSRVAILTTTCARNASGWSTFALTPGRFFCLQAWVVAMLPILFLSHAQFDSPFPGSSHPFRCLWPLQVSWRNFDTGMRWQRSMPMTQRGFKHAQEVASKFVCAAACSDTFSTSMIG